MNETIFTYKTIASPAEGSFKDRGSKFLAFGYPIQYPDDIKEILRTLKKEHPKANHHCFAFRTGTDGLSFRANDDGEPSGSAGKPILGQIDSTGLTNVLVVVVRYFGGTLLGVPGLINAYKTATVDCLQMAEVIERNIEFTVGLEFDYSIMNDVMQVLKQFEVSIHTQEMLLFCRYIVGIPLVNKDLCLERLAEIRGLEFQAVV